MNGVNERLTSDGARQELLSAFLSAQGVDVEGYFTALKQFRVSGRRFFRLRPNLNSEQLKLVAEELPEAQPAMNNPKLFSVPRMRGLRCCESQRQGLITGIDIGSVTAVLALDLRRGEDVLDLCAAPGAKTLFMHDIQLESGSPFGRLWANDLSSRRLATARRLFAFHGAQRIETFCGDARLLCPATLGGSRPHKVLADVECTHDGSFKHVLRFLDEQPREIRSAPTGLSKRAMKLRARQIAQSQAAQSEPALMQRLVNPTKAEELFELQRAVLRKALELVKPGGRVVYSTCSLCPAQNEDAVTAVLREVEHVIEPVTLLDLREELAAEMDWLIAAGFSAGGLPGTLRLDPTRSGCGGFFVAALHKSGP